MVQTDKYTNPHTHLFSLHTMWYLRCIKKGLYT